MIITSQKRPAASIALIFVLALGSIHLAQAQTIVQPPVLAGPAKVGEEDEFIRQGYAQTARTQLDMLGITDPAIQEAVVELSRKQRLAITPLKDQARHLARSLELKNSSDAQISALLADLQGALKAEKQRRAQDLADFEVKFPLAQHSRLQTALMFFNLLGEEAAVLDNIPRSLQRLAVKTVPQAAKQLAPDDEVFGKMVTMFVAQQEKAMRPLLARAKENRLSEMARPRLSEEESSAFSSNFRMSVAQFEERRQNSLKILDAKTGYTQKPRLQAALFLLGITGNDIGLLNGFDIDGSIGFPRYTNVITGADIEF